MRFRRLFLIGSTLTASCNSAPTEVAKNDDGISQEAAANFSPTSPQPLQLTVVTKPLRNGLRVEGRTNLPDGTELLLNLQRGPVLGGDKEFVQSGRFQEDIFPRNGQPIPTGSYDVEVRTPLGDLQPPNVKEQLGSDYEALTGPLIMKSEVSGGRIIDYTSKANIGGVADPRADEQARKTAYRQHEAYSERACRSNPDEVERLTGTAMTAVERASSVQTCLKMMERSRQGLVQQGLLQRP